MAYTDTEVNKVLGYVKKKYSTKPEFLWFNTPDNAILRHKDNSKWYGALLKISPGKLLIEGNKDIYILNLKCTPMLMSFIIDRKKIFPGYHMNKRNWISVILDGSIKPKKLFSLIDLSYDLTSSPEKKKISSRENDF